MDDAQESQYNDVYRRLRKMAMESTRYLSAWLQWSLSRPNSAFRDEVVELPFTVGQDEEGNEITQKRPYMDLPAVTAADSKSAERWLPKERWLSDYCRAERAQGRKVLVYVRQTGTRDIQERVKACLEAAGLRTTVLSGNVSPRRREKWVEQRAPRLDALICNPRLVETGLDLVQFATVVFYEIEYSLYTLWQACRRVWRLGQTRPVKVLFAVYDGSMEAKALALMGRKMKAAQLLYGDEVGGAIVPEASDDFLTELAREVLADKELPDLRALFTDEGDVTAAAVGSLTQVSPRLTWNDLVRLYGKGGSAHSHSSSSSRRRRRRKKAPAQNQMGLPGFGRQQAKATEDQASLPGLG
jgi:hypothetical protein